MAVAVADVVVDVEESKKENKVNQNSHIVVVHNKQQKNDSRLLLFKFFNNQSHKKKEGNMKKIMTLLLATWLALSGSAYSTANAVEIKAGGEWQFGMSWDKVSTDKHDRGEVFHAVQRIRPQFNFIADENLSATLQFEIGDGHFGNDGWALGNDGHTVKVRYGYVDWKVPGLNFDTRVRMGMMDGEVPTYTFHTPFAVETAGVAINSEFCDNAGITLGWFRPYNHDTKEMHDTIDVFVLSLPLKGDGWEVTPWGMATVMGHDSLSKWWKDVSDGAWSGGSELAAIAGLLPYGIPARYKPLTDEYDPILGGYTKSRPFGWWLGVGGEISLFDPLTVAFDLTYGAFDAGKYAFDDTTIFKMKRKGWMASALASYDAATLGIDLAGTWGIGIHFDDISFIDNLTHNLRFTYYQGTNNVEIIRGDHPVRFINDLAAEHNSIYLTTSDRAFEVNFENAWEIYKNLVMNLELGYIRLDLEKKVWGFDSADFTKNLWKVGIYMTYSF